MSDERFDAIVVGAGPAGSSAALEMARAGLEVLLIERGDEPGMKNMTGGRLYGHSLEKMIPGFAEEAPVERKVTKEMISMLTDDSCFTMDFSSRRFAAGGGESYTVLRAEFDPWLAEQAEEEGVVLASGVRVEELHMVDGKVSGVVADEDVLESDCVVLCDGVNSLLAQKAGLKKELTPHQVAVGFKEIIELPEKVIEDRFNLSPGEGAARLFAGSCSKGLVGGGFVYTNKQSLSVGLVMHVNGAIKGQHNFCDLLNEFKEHPAVAPLIEGGRCAEYAAHLVPEAGINMLPALSSDGVLVAGDAAGLVVNTGYTIRGMDLAIESGRLAAKAVIKAKETEDFSKSGLASYEAMLKDSFVFKDLETFKEAPEFMETPGLYGEYPALIADIFSAMFKVDGTPAKPVSKKVMPLIKKAGLMNLAKVAWKGRKL